MVFELLENLRNYAWLADWRDFVDILIVAFLVYKLLALIRNTTAAQVLKVLIAACCPWSLRASQIKDAEFHTFKHDAGWTYSDHSPVPAGAKKMLESAGARRFPKLLINRTDDEQTRIEMVLNQTVNACSQLSKNRVGALIVFEQRSF